MGWTPQERRLQLDRIRQVVADLLKPAVYSDTHPLTVAARHLPGEPVSAGEAQAGDFEPFAVGQQWGPRWGTTWFRMEGRVPSSWAGRQVVARVELGGGSGGVGFGTEGLIWRGDQPVQGVSPNHTFLPVADPAAGDEEVHFYVEAAANPAADGSLLLPDPGGPPISHLARAQLAVRHPEVAELIIDIDHLRGLARYLPEDDPRGQEVLRALARFSAALDPDDVRSSAAAARACLDEVLSRPAVASAHRVVAAGHAHIDSAWLWPLRETVRKCARSFSTAVSLMDEYPEYKFVCSQAQQHAWMKESYPSLYERMRKKAASGQFEPVGSMWVETDCNVPSGESLARQLIYGKRFFLEEYGVETHDVWLPDVFGYSAALPQLMKLAGIEWFLTQKISWSDTNTFPHHTFWWEGIDGTRIFSHFPPSDTYNGDVSVRELLHATRNFKDHGHARMSLYPIGFGDGGGGPTREHIERTRLSGDLEGLPRVAFGGVRDFFEAAVADAEELATWVGELYLEYHRGTYTTQARVKRGNREGELSLREAELWSSLSGIDYPAGEIETAWKTLLLNQFHDILPGSGIHWVYRDAERDHAGILKTATAIIDDAAGDIAARVDATGLSRPVVVFNALSHARVAEVVEIDGALRQVTVPALGYAVVDAAGADARSRDEVAVTELATGGRLDNNHLSVEWDGDGLLTSVWDKEAMREVIAPGQRANLFQLHVDRPIHYDAWDIDRFYLDARVDVTDADTVEIVERGPLRAVVRVTRSFGSSTVEQLMSLEAGSRRLDFRTTVDWHERHRLLKVAFPVDVHSPRATYEIQFGHVERPTYTNTSWDWARFEVCAHKWADLAEPDYGVALLNDCKYGYDIHGNVMRLTLLRSPTSPDPEADQGAHEFTYALYPHPGDLRSGGVIQSAYELNSPLRVVIPDGRATTRASCPASASLLTVDRPGVIVEAVKRAEDSDGLIVRMYEAYGQRQQTRLELSRPIAAATVVDLLERDLEPLEPEGTSVALSFRPFEIKTIKLIPSS